MIPRIAFGALATLTAGCMTVAPQDGPPARGSSGFRCEAGRAQSLVGGQASSQLAAEAQRLSRAGTARWLEPGQIVTMEYRADRLNIEIDRNRRVIAIRCG